MQSKPPYTVNEATRKLENYCSYQERCHKEVLEKLKELNMIPLAIDSIMTHLIEHNFLNEERFARSFARGKFNIKKWGKNRIVRELKFRGISRFNINLALQEISEAEYAETFDKLAQKQLEKIKEASLLKKKKKLADYLIYRGWEPEMVYDKVNELLL